MRIAHLEREAGIFQKIKNIPKTFFGKIKAVGSEISSFFAINPKKMFLAKETVIQALGKQLELRIRSAQDVNTFLDDTSFITVSKFNLKYPERSLVRYEGEEMTLMSLIKSPEITIEMKKDVKGAYVSFYKDYKNSILRMQGIIDTPTKEIDSFFLRLKRVSKLAYRILKTLFDLGFVVAGISGLVYMESINDLINNNFPGILSHEYADVMVPMRDGINALSTFGMVRIAKSILNVAESTLRRSDSNMKEFDDIVSGRTASSYTHTARFARQLEQYC